MERIQSRLRLQDMSTRSLATLVILICGIAQALGAPAPPGPRVPPYLPIPAGSAVIMNSGSTNASGYRIVVQRQGAVEYVAGNRRSTSTLTSQTADKFFSDLTAASPLDRLPSAPCMKSVSFGSSLFVWWQGHGRSPDLMCPTGDRGARLREDVDQITGQLGLAPMPVMRPALPGEQHRPVPTSSP